MGLLYGFLAFFRPCHSFACWFLPPNAFAVEFLPSLCCWLGGCVKDLSRPPPWVLVPVLSFAPFFPWPLGLLIFCSCRKMPLFVIVSLSFSLFSVLCIDPELGVSFFSLIWIFLLLIWPGRFLMGSFTRPSDSPLLVMIFPRVSMSFHELSVVPRVFC